MNRDYPGIAVPEGHLTVRKSEYENKYFEQWSEVQEQMGRLGKELNLLREVLFRFMGPSLVNDRGLDNTVVKEEMSEASLEVRTLATQLRILNDDIADIRQRVFN